MPKCPDSQGQKLGPQKDRSTRAHTHTKKNIFDASIQRLNTQHSNHTNDPVYTHPDRPIYTVKLH